MLKSLNELLLIVEEFKNQGKKIVTFNGSFDILHAGHIKAFREAKSKGDCLIVFINSDKSVKSYKGEDRPIIPEQDRALMVSAIDGVDYVSLFDESDPRVVLEQIKPHIHCNGLEWGENCVEAKVVKENGGEIHILKQHNGISTSKIIEKILKLHKKE